MQRGLGVWSVRAAAAIFLLLSGLPVQAATYDHLYRSGFDPITDAPASDAEAARFLTQATFGPTRSEIARLRGIGYGQWIDQQLSQAGTLARPFIEVVGAALNAGGQGFGHSQRLDRWFHTATFGSDQLRQRTAWALSQIFVISDQNGTLAGEVVQVTEYWDLLARNAFGNYRDLLEEVTYSPSMGKYLSHFRNRKAATGRQPDENYAREIMQLFSIGLVERNLDFSPILGGGLPLPTYDQTDIVELAKVFTGFNYHNATTISNGTNDYRSMTCIAVEHDVTQKNFLSNSVVAGQLCAPRPDGSADVVDVDAALNIIFNHPNVAPFISRQLIQRFVTSNPSPQYIQRVAQVFQNNGAGERGDFGAVVKAILLDSEARNAAPPVTFGKVREPLLRLTALWRAWDALAPAVNQYGEIKMGITNPAPTYGQRPLGAPTVFNFYEPDYQQPGAIAAANLYSPELQVVNESTIYATANSLYTFSFSSYQGMVGPPTDRPLINLTGLTALVASPSAMVDEANVRMTYGSMSPAMRTTLINTLTFMNGAAASEKALTLIYLVALSPEYAVQR